MNTSYATWCAVLTFSLLVNGYDAELCAADDGSKIANSYCESTTADKVLTPGFIQYDYMWLELMECNITSIQYGAFNNVTYVQGLNLTGNKIHHIDGRSFDSLNNLHYLLLANNNIRGENLDPDVFRNIKDLYRLVLSGNNMTGAPEDLLEGSTIKFVELDNCSLYDVPAFVVHRNLNNLAHITLAGNHLQKLSDPDLFSNLPELLALDLSNNDIDYLHEDLFKKTSSLYELSLQHNKLTYLPEGLLRNLPRLYDVNLSYNLLTTVSANAFTGTTPSGLNLQHNKITNLPVNFDAQFMTGQTGNYPRGYLLLKIKYNPWQCACYNEFFNEMRNSKAIRISKLGISGEEDIPCAAPNDTVCHREVNH